jgi:phage terminase large subunit-like protein
MPTAPATRRKPTKGPARGAHAVVDFINGLKHTGDYLGVPFKLRPWQEDIIRKMFTPAGKARYQTVFIGLPRKQGKTELVAAILLYLMFGTGTPGKRIFSASGNREQAALIHGAAAAMVRQSEALSSYGHVFDSTKEIRLEAIDSKYKALSSEAKGQYGLRPSELIFDEFWVLPNRDLYNATTTGFGATRRPLILIISTAGWDRTSLCWEQWNHARAVRDGLVEDPAFLPILYEADPEDDWTDEAVWQKVMPALGDFCELAFIRKECEKAKRLPAYQNTFRQLYLNQWTEQAERWIATEAWAACMPRVEPMAMEGRYCYMGLDLGITGDMACAALAFPDGSGGYDVLAHGWAPREGRWRDEPRNRDRYELWAREGWLTLTPGDVIDHNRIEADLVRWAQKYPMRLGLGDRAYATQLLIRLVNDHGLNWKGIPQGPVTLNEAMVRLEELVISRQVRCDNPILAWNVANAVVRRNPTGLMHLDKSQASERIDGLQALVNALAGAVSDPDNLGPSVYETRGPIFL